MIRNPQKNSVGNYLGPYILPLGHVHGDSEPPPVEFSRNRDNPFIDAVAGTICAGIAFTLLWLNEGHAVRIEQLLDLVRRRVIEIGPTAVPGNQRQLVYLQGDAASADQLVLPEWANISAPANSAKLRAQLGVVQWCWVHLEFSSKTAFDLLSCGVTLVRS